MDYKLNDLEGDDREAANDDREEWVRATAEQLYEELTAQLPEWLIDYTKSSDTIWEATWAQAEVMYKEYLANCDEP